MLLLLNNICCWPPWSVAPSRFLNETYIFSKSDRFVYARRCPADPGQLLFFPPGRPEPWIPLRTSLEKSKKRRAKTLVAKKLVDSTMNLAYLRLGAPRAAPPVTPCARLVRPWLPLVPPGVVLGVILDGPGVLVDPFRFPRGLSWRLVAWSWDPPGLFWGPLASSWAPLGVVLGATGAPLGSTGEPPGTTVALSRSTRER